MERTLLTLSAQAFQASPAPPTTDQWPPPPDQRCLWISPADLRLLNEGSMPDSSPRLTPDFQVVQERIAATADAALSGARVQLTLPISQAQALLDFIDDLDTANTAIEWDNPPLSKRLRALLAPEQLDFRRSLADCVAAISAWNDHYLRVDDGVDTLSLRPLRPARMQSPRSATSTDVANTPPDSSGFYRIDWYIPPVLLLDPGQLEVLGMRNLVRRVGVVFAHLTSSEEGFGAVEAYAEIVPSQQFIVTCRRLLSQRYRTYVL